MKLFKLLLLITSVVFLLGNSKNTGVTDYDIELAQINANILQLSDDSPKALVEKEAALRLIYFLYLKATLTGNFEHFKIIETEINSALKNYGFSRDLYLLRAHLNFKLHRLKNAKSDLQMLPNAADSLQVRVLNADIYLQEGKYAKAQEGYQSILKESRTWDNLARMAYFKLQTGHPLEASELYEEAKDKFSAKEMRSYAWVELQEGLLDLQYERYEEALVHYRQANQAYSGYWLIEEHIAEVLYLLGHRRESINLYEKIIEKTQNPELVSALANIIEDRDYESAINLRKKAEKLYAKRLDLYSEAAIGHLVVHLLNSKDTDVRLIGFARRNYQLRPNAQSKLLLARAYLKEHKVSLAKKLLKEVLETPWRTPELFRLLKEVE